MPFLPFEKAPLETGHDLPAALIRAADPEGANQQKHEDFHVELPAGG
jgi:hypothetical protein